MKIAFKTLVFGFFLLAALSADFEDQMSPKLAAVKEAQAIIGMPFTPVSYAGVARRTTRRVVYTEAAVATTAAATATAASASAAAAAASASKPAAPPAAPAAAAVPIGTVVQALPGGCKSVVVNGVSYSDCGGVFYKAAFQGSNLVYVVVERPL
jgi:nucleoid-associated protein YgaU